VSRYVGNGDECPTCGTTYGAFRTGFTWRDVWLFFWTPQDAPPDEWKRKSRGVILGRWFEIKQSMWKQHVEECAEQRAFEERSAGMIKVYVAGSTRQRDRAREFFERVRAHGDMCIAYDWLVDVDASDAAGVQDNELSDSDRAKFARADLDGVARADVLVVLAEATPTGRGMWVELGFALGLQRAGLRSPMIVVSGGDKRSIFSSPNVVDYEVGFAVGEHDEEAFEIVAAFAQDFDGAADDDVRVACEFCGAAAQSPAVGVRCGKCGARRVTDAEVGPFDAGDFDDEGGAS